MYWKVSMLKPTRVLLLATLCLYAPHPTLAGNNSGQAFSIWPDTGQNTCYDTDGNVLYPCPPPDYPFYGQDAQNYGPARSYTKLDVSGNTLPESATSWAMVRDNVTGLIWEAKQAKDGVKNYTNPHDADNSYTWCDTNPDTNGGDQGTCGTNDTEDFVSALNSGSGFGGHTDWRLPTIKELKTLVDRGRDNPAIPTTYFSEGVSSWYWSSTTAARGVTFYAWSVNFYLGNAVDYQKVEEAAYHVRAVRGGQVQPDDRFVDNQDGTVTDTLTCLQWQQATADTTGDGVADLMTWESALAYAEGLFFAGHNDWRLPDMNELTSIVDYSRFDPAIDPTYFPDTVSFYYWSSTTAAYNPHNAWLVLFNLGYGLSGPKSYSYYVRAVRGGRCGGFKHFPWPMFMPAILNEGQQ